MEKYNKVLVVGDVSMFDKMDKGDCEIVRTINVSLDDFDEAVELYTNDTKELFSVFPKWKGVDAIVLCIRDITELKDFVSQDYMNTVSAVLGEKEDVFMLLGSMGRLQPDLCRDISKSMMYAGLATKARYDEPMVKNNIGTGTARGIDTPVQVYAQKFGASSKAKHTMSQTYELVDQAGHHYERPQKRLDVYQLDQGMKPYQPLAQPTVDFVDAPRACAGCTCGRVQAEAAAAAYHSQVAQVHLGNAQLAQATSACGNCYLGDAFRCAGCPQRGMPAFSPGSMAQI